MPKQPHRSPPLAGGVDDGRLGEARSSQAEVGQGEGARLASGVSLGRAGSPLAACAIRLAVATMAAGSFSHRSLPAR
ncbi:hypothetical protein [Streptomyces chartreusis]|uniref:hypothetical protein n=1 Tax=Streptomyces chartreusis TaxID=1969 RepID=UPI003630B5CC